MEKISVLMPVYNREDFIGRAIESILNQTYKNIEIIICDDGSTDDTFNICCKYYRANFSKIIVISYKTNEGVGYARNTLLRACNTKYAVWMDSDDIAHPERIEKQLKRMNICPDPNNLVYCGWKNLKNNTTGTTLGFATLMFPVNKDILFQEDILFGGEDRLWREEMHKVYPSTLVKDVLYSIDFHDNRIGSWKRKIDKDWNGKYDLKTLNGLSYEDIINKYKKEYIT